MKSPTLPAIYALHLADLIENRFGVTKGALWAAIGSRRESLEALGARLTVEQFEALAARAIELSQEPALPIFYGMQMRVSAHGYLGFAAMTARTLGDALMLGERFAPTRTTALSLRVEDDYDDERVALTIDEHWNAGAARGAFLFALIIGLWKIGNDLTGRELHGECEISAPEPAYYSRFAHLFPQKPRFSAAATRLVFAREYLALPLVRADVEALRLARAECERELDALFSSDDLARTRLALPKKGGGFRSEDEVAHALALSTRTLKRRLAAHGTTFSQLLDEARATRAMALLGDPHRGVEAVALELGYSDAANFSRAFKRWTRESPGRFRRRATA